jgi:hypothetical protein
MPDSYEAFLAWIPQFSYRVQQLRVSASTRGDIARQIGGGPVGILRRDIASEIGGAASEYLLGRRRPGQRIGHVLVDDGRRIRVDQALSAQRQSALGLLEELDGQIVQGLGDPIDWRFRRHLRAALSNARSVQRPRTILDRITATLGEITAYSPPDDDFTVVRKLDRRFRQLIRGRLSSIAPDWWATRISPSIRRRAEAGRNAGGDPQADPLLYLTFGDYGKVMLDHGNWVDAFQTVLGERGLFETKFRMITALRNGVAHSRPLSSAQRLNFRTLAIEILPAG